MQKFGINTLMLPEKLKIPKLKVCPTTYTNLVIYHKNNDDI